MKREFIYFVVGFFFWYIITIHMVSAKCKEYEGWEYYSVFPVPMCHVEAHTSTITELQYYKELLDAKPIKTYSL